MEEIKLIAQFGVGGLSIYLMFRIVLAPVVGSLTKITENHLDHIQRGVESLKETAEGHGSKLGSIDENIKELVNLKKNQLQK